MESMNRREWLKDASAMALTGAAGLVLGKYCFDAEAVQEKQAVEKGPYAILVSEATSKDWKPVVDKLAEKYKGRSKVVIYKKDIEETQDELARLGPREIAYVGQLAEVKPEKVREISKFVRILDKDPYFDAILGVITGIDGKDALRLAECDRIEAGTGLLKTLREFLPFFNTAWYYSETIPGNRKDGRGGENATMRDGALKSQMFGLENLVYQLHCHLESEVEKPNVFVTGGTSNHNIWECSTGDVRDGAFLSRKGGDLVAIDDLKLEALKAKQDYRRVRGSKEWELRTDRPKIWYAARSPLIGQVKDDSSMVPAAIRHMGVRLMWASTKDASYGDRELGTGLQYYWRQGKRTPESGVGLTFPEAAFAAQQQLVYSMELAKQKISDEPDTFVLYGDPGLDSRFAINLMRMPEYDLHVKSEKKGGEAELTIEYLCRAEKLDDPILLRPVAIYPRRLSEPSIAEKSGVDRVFVKDNFALLDFYTGRKASVSQGHKARVVISGKLD